ncbi:MAG: hypothetical protein HFJ03_02735 [Lachnospira sp.]|jgi:hypothetical protein|nr:hypothetical protein [Lachnospira sp.]
MKKEVKTKMKGITLAIFFVLIVFIYLIALNNKTSDNNKVDLVITAKTILKNVLIIQHNVDECFITI